MKHINILLLTLMVVTLVLVGCSKVNEITKPDELNQAIPYENETNATYSISDFSSVTIVPLIAGNELNVGSVSIMTEEYNLLVTYRTMNGWLLRETNLEALPELKRIPLTKENIPDVERFTFRTMHYVANDKINNGVMEYTYKIPLENSSYKMMKDIAIVANAVLINEKTPVGLGQQSIGWGGIERGRGPGNWRYIQYYLDDNNPRVERPNAEIDVFNYDGKSIK